VTGLNGVQPAIINSANSVLRIY